MRRKIVRKIAPFLCSLMIFTVPWVSAASQPSRATTQEIALEPESRSEAADTESKEKSHASTKEELPALQETKTYDQNVTIDPDDSITLIETESVIDADGNVTMTVNTAEDLILPVIMTMKGAEGIVSMTITRSGQGIKIKPDIYNITKAVDGNGKKLPSGAELRIPKEGGTIYLDFNKPDEGDNTAIDFLKTNGCFLVIAAFLICLYRKYFHH